MVFKSVAFALLFSLSAEAAAPALVLNWVGSKSAPCQHLTETFLSELRSMANDRPIELEAVSASATRDPADAPQARLRLECREPKNGDAGAIELTGAAGETSVVRYVPKAQGFNALDWLAFQQHYLRPVEAISLAPPPSEPKVAALENVEPMSSSQTELNKTPIYQHWWFWALIGSAGAGLYALTRSGSRDNNSNVEIH